MKTIQIPHFLHEIHGEETPLLTLILVYLTGILAAIFIFFVSPKDLVLFKKLVFAFLYFDIAGGVVANLSSSTNLFYQKSLRTRIAYTILHFSHPAFLVFVFPSAIPYAVFTVSFALPILFLLNLVKKREFQQNIAATLLTFGVLFSFLFPLEPKILYTFAPLFMTKLILGFGVQRPSLD